MDIHLCIFNNWMIRLGYRMGTVTQVFSMLLQRKKNSNPGFLNVSLTQKIKGKKSRKCFDSIFWKKIKEFHVRYAY